MGVYLGLAISQSITPKEWEEVYEETLQLVDAFPLAEFQVVPVRGFETDCLVRTRERDFTLGWGGERMTRGWKADGDYEYLGVAESHSLMRDEIDDKHYDADAPDAMLEHAMYVIEDDKSKYGRIGGIRHLWGNKTQGEPYHIYLLAIACLIETRLGHKAYVYGDIYERQCAYAVSLANRYLAVPIRVPDRCDPDRFAARVLNLPLTEADQLDVYISEYLGRMGDSFGANIRKHFSKESQDRYWIDRFREYPIGSYCFKSELRRYLSWGFDLEELCSLVPLTEDEGHSYYGDFVQALMDTKLHLSRKDIDEVSVSDTMSKEDAFEALRVLVDQLILDKNRYQKVNRDIPLEEIRSALSRAMGDVCPTDALIDEYLKRERKEAFADIKKLMAEGEDDGTTEDAPCSATRDANASQAAGVKRDDKAYDIVEVKKLPYFKAGDTLHPTLMTSVGKSYAVYRELVSEDRFQELMERTPEGRYVWLERNNQNLFLRDIDWERIYDEIVERPEAFERYYPMVRVRITNDGNRAMVRAFVTNDDLYAYAAELADGVD